MPLPIAVVAPIALRYGAVALATLAAARVVQTGFLPGARDQSAEDALDRAPEGLSTRVEPEQKSATARFRRVFRWKDGRAVEVDLAALGRLRIRRL